MTQSNAPLWVTLQSVKKIVGTHKLGNCSSISVDYSLQDTHFEKIFNNSSH